jgi:hypothetical protein
VRAAWTWIAAMAGLVALAGLPFMAVHLPASWEAGCALGELSAIGLLALCALPVRSRLGHPATGLSLTRHRDLGVLVLGLALAHAVLLLIAQPLLVEYIKPSTPLYQQAGVAGLVAVIALVATGFLVVRRRLWPNHGQFQLSHLVLTLAALALVAAHAVGSARYVDRRWKIVVWTVATLAAALCLLRARRQPRASAAALERTQGVGWIARAPFGRHAKLVAGLIALLALVLAMLSLPGAVTTLIRTPVAPQTLLPLDFPHVRHTSVGCLVCHHNYVDRRGSDGCLSCHRSARPDLLLGAEARFHGFCMQCHLDKARSQARAGPVRACSTCHRTGVAEVALARER